MIEFKNSEGEDLLWDYPVKAKVKFSLGLPSREDLVDVA